MHSLGSTSWLKIARARACMCECVSMHARACVYVCACVSVCACVRARACSMSLQLPWAAERRGKKAIWSYAAGIGSNFRSCLF